MSDATEGRCPTCGRPLDAHEPNFRFRFPDAVVDLLEAGLDPDELHGDPAKDILLEVEDAGCFVRVLLPIRLSEGFQLTLGTWLQVEFEDLERTLDVYRMPGFHELVLSGTLANAVPPWGGLVLDAPATAAILNENDVPYVMSSTDPLLSRVLQEEWPHDDVLSAFP